MRLTRRAEAEGVKAVYYGKNDVFLEGEPGYAEANKLAHYEDLEESGRLVVLPEVFDEKKLFRVLSYSACPNVFNLPRSEKCPVIPCKDCWENALKIKE